MERFQNETQSGTMAINDTIVQFAGECKNEFYFVENNPTE